MILILHYARSKIIGDETKENLWSQDISKYILCIYVFIEITV